MDKQLRSIIKNLIADAKHRAPKPVRRSLSRGLTLNLRKDNGSYILTLWRHNNNPSMREWNIICSHFPYKIPILKPKSGKFEQRHYLQGLIPSQSSTKKS